MGVSFLEYATAMVGCYSAMPEHEREALHAWEAEHLVKPGIYGTSDWPGWEKYIGKFSPSPPSKEDTYGYVYLIKSESGHCKIGSSRLVQRRIKQLQCANAGRLHLLHHFPSPNAKQDERALHKKFAHRRMMNEWFALTDSEITAICSISSSHEVAE